VREIKAKIGRRVHVHDIDHNDLGLGTIVDNMKYPGFPVEIPKIKLDKKHGKKRHVNGWECWWRPLDLIKKQYPKIYKKLMAKCE
jgi:hypothetical protein